jgi:hypothetical protein
MWSRVTQEDFRATPVPHCPDKTFFSEEQQLFSDDLQFFSEGSETATILRRMATF